MSTTSATSTDVYSQTLPGGKTVEEYLAMTDEEQAAYWNEVASGYAADGLSDEEIADEIEEDKAEIGELIEDCQDYVDALQDVQDGSSDETVEAWIETIDEIQEELEQAQDYAEDAQDFTASLNLDYSDGSDVNVDDDSFETSTEGYTYTYSLGGGTSSNPFDTSDSGQTDEEYLIEMGITDENGIVISDVDANGIMNYADVEAALAARESEDLYAQNIFISGNDHWELVSADGDTYTFKVTDADDPTKFCYVTFENAGDVVFYFGGNTITEADIGTITNNWPSELKDKCQWGDTGETFTQLTTEEEETTTEARYAAIEDYEEAAAGITSATVTTYVGGTDATVQETAQEALDMLFSYLDDPTQSITDIWAEIYQLMAEQGLSAEQQSNVIKTLVLDVSIYSAQYFNTFFGAVVTTLETTIDYEKAADEYDKACILLLECLTAGGKYGGPSMVWQTLFSADGENQGTWHDNDENIAAIGLYKTIMSLGGNLLSGFEDSVIAYETQVIENEDYENSDESRYDELVAQYGAEFVNWLNAMCGDDYVDLTDDQVTSFYNQYLQLQEDSPYF